MAEQVPTTKLEIASQFVRQLPALALIAWLSWLTLDKLPPLAEKCIGAVP